MVKETIPFNFNDIYSYIEDKFNEKGYDIEEGSNTMQLVTAMSYLTSMLNSNTATNINETLLTLARKRSTALQDARVLGYEIAHIQSYQYDLDLEFNNTSAAEQTYVIEKYEHFTSGDKTYYYMGSNIDVVVPPNSTGTITITVKEGDLKKFRDNPDTLSLIIRDVYNETSGEWSTQHYVDIAFTDIEENGIEVFLTYYDELATYYEQEEWTRSTQFMIDADTVLSRQFVRLDNIEYRTPRIYFKLGDVGQEIRSGTIIEMNVLVSSGAEGEITGTVSASDLPDCTVTGYTLKIQGAEEESISTVKQNAPLFHNTANRIITKPDYVAFCNRQPSVKYSDVWDGQDEFPHRPGHIWFSFVPSTLNREILDLTETTPGAGDGLGKEWNLQNLDTISNWYVEPAEIQNSTDGIWDILNNYKVPTLEFHHRNPVYIDFEYDVKIARYSVKTSESDINLGVFTVINDYFRDELQNSTNPDIEEESAETFGYEYFQSNLVKRIDKDLTDVMGFDLYLTTSINISDNNIIEEIINEVTEEYYKEIRFHLGIPFEDIFDVDNNVIFDNLPSINTEDFYLGELLWTDESTMIIDTSYSQMLITSYDIKIGTTVVGEYRVYNGSYSDIEIILWVQDVVNGHVTGLQESALDSSSGETNMFINISYNTPNIAMARNMIPRLKRVKFI